MKCKVFTFILAAGLLFSGPLYSNEQGLRIQGLTERQTIEFINGAAIAFSYYDHMLRSQGKERLICTPEHGIGGQDVWDAASRALVGAHEEDMVVIAALDELQREYPCN